MGLATALLRSRVSDRLDNAPNLVAERRQELSTRNGIREDWIQVGSVSTHYLEKGSVDGPVIILLQPSGNADPWSWENVMRELPEKYRVIAPGFQGFGKTELPEDTKCTVENLSESVKDFLSAKGIEGPVWMMGTSAGAFVAMMFAAENPGRVERLAVIDSYDPRVLAEYPRFISWALSHPTLSLKGLRFSLRHKGLFEASLMVYEQINGTQLHEKEQSDGEKDGVDTGHRSTLKVSFNALRSMRKPGQKISNELIEGTMEYLRNIRPAFFHIISDHRRHAGMYEDMLAAIAATVPVKVVIHGAGDLVIKEEASREVAELLGAKYHPIDGSGHAPHKENTAKFMEIIRTDFLPKEEVQELQPERHQHRSLMSRLLRRERRRQHQVQDKEASNLEAA